MGVNLCCTEIICQLKINFQHITRAVLFLSVFLLIGFLSNKSRCGNKFFSDDETADVSVLSIENNMMDYTACDLEKDAEEKIRIIRKTGYIYIWNEYSISQNCISPNIFNFHRQIPVLISRIDLPPPAFI